MTCRHCGAKLRRLTADLYVCVAGHVIPACGTCYAPTHITPDQQVWTCDTDYCRGNSG